MDTASQVPGTPPSPRPALPPSRAPGLAVASLVLGILGLATSFLLVGALLAVIGLILGVIHLRRRTESRLLGWSGVWLSIFALVATAGFVALYAFGLQRMRVAGMPGGVQMGSGNFAEWRGREAPDFEVVTLDGDRVRLSELKGKRVVLDFWATWCPPCVQEIPHFIQLRKDLPDSNLAILGLSREDRAVLKPFTGAKGMNYPVASLADVDLPAPYAQIQSIPTTFFLDASGRVEEVLVGYHDYATLRRLAAGETAPARDEGKASATP